MTFDLSTIEITVVNMGLSMSGKLHSAFIKAFLMALVLVASAGGKALEVQLGTCYWLYELFAGHFRF